MIARSVRQRRAAVIICVTVAFFATFAGWFGQTFGSSRTPFFLPITVTWSLCDLLTAFLLLAQFFVSRRLVFGILAAGYACSGFLTWPYSTISFDIVRYDFTAEAQLPPALYLLWHLLFPLFVIAAFTYERENELRQLDQAAVARVVAGLAAGSAALSFAAAAAVIALRKHLPTFIADGRYQIAYWAVAMPIVIVASLAALIMLVARGRRLNGVPLWVAVALFASLVDTLLSEFSPTVDTWSWEADNVLTLVTASTVAIFMLSEIVGMYAQNSARIATQSQQAAARIRALWQISTSEGMSERDHVQMILDAATANIRSDRCVFGFLSHVENGTVTVDAIACSDQSPELDRARAIYTPGVTFLLADELHAPIYASGRTVTWTEASGNESLLPTNAGFQSMIGSPVHENGRTHFIIFGLPHNLGLDPFVESDIAFVDVIASNISHRYYQRSQFERFQFLIEHDSLTALFTRAQFHRAGRSAAADGTLFGIIMIDLDRFREVNERAGQRVGDELLVEIAAALQAVDRNDLVARVGGASFAVMLRSIEPARTLGARLESYAGVFREPFNAGDRNGPVYIDVHASLGAMRFDPATSTFEETLSRASIALDNAKEHGGARGIEFGPDLERVALQRALERNELLAALANDELVLAYQPTVKMSTRTVVGAEALLRWQHPLRGLLAPVTFLGAVKRANLLGEVTTWVVRRVARDFGQTPVPPGFRIYCNVPAQVLESETFLIGLEQLLTAVPGFSQLLGIEITESDAMNRVERAIEALVQIRRLGLLVAIDDFGTGYSSLSYLKRLPIDVVKLDKSFIDGLPDDPNDVALAEMFLTLTRQFSLVSVGEGIETEAQAGWLLEHGCMVGQGFLFSRPLPLDAFISYLHAHAGA